MIKTINRYLVQSGNGYYHSGAKPQYQLTTDPKKATVLSIEQAIEILDGFSEQGLLAGIVIADNAINQLPVPEFKP